MASRQDNGEFSFESQNTNYFPRLNLIREFDWTNFQCLTAKYNPSTKFLDLRSTDCHERHAIVCRKVLFTRPNCTKYSAFKGKTMLEIMLSKELKLFNRQMIAYKKAEIKDIMQRLSQNVAYQSIFKTLWYAPLPCFDIRNLTTDSEGTSREGGSSILRYCEWKGISISCSAIFNQYPTDQGMCCSFNTAAAEDIYVKTKYTNLLTKMQNTDKITSFTSR